MLNGRPVDILQQWHQRYGPIVSFRFGQQLAISVGSLDIAHDLFNKRGAIHNSRPRFSIATEMTSGLNTAVMPYGKQWQNQHRIVSPMLDSSTVGKYHVLEDMESKQTLSELLHTSNWEDTLSRYAGSVLMTLGYGIRLENSSNKIPARIMELNAKPFEAIGNTYYQLAALFPSLDRLPSFLTPWKWDCASVEKQTTEFHMEHLEFAKSTSSWNWIQEALQSKAGSQASPKELAYAIGTLEQAGFEAIFTVLRLLVKALVLHPHCLKEAQRELDQVVGPGRMPSNKDIPNLPYLRAMINEAMRWQSPAPFALPHATTENDEYMGYHIPKGTIVIPNNWTISFDPEIFPDPYDFRPERWIQNLSLEHRPFGFGRRVCPGQHLAWSSISIIMARLVWAYDISYAYKDGKRVEIDPWDIKILFTASSMPFDASFKVRSAETQELIEREWENACKDTAQISGQIWPNRGM
ncbi:cytochrome P450 [Penicillium bovifimosum]|uniref:Cytochrome P450 n=1 Tax=Penicillium bovifimosum TaxID=126998 RepID=A0A9W9GMU2_9EURO|nr:cytochrome P450 [Penicillium bovifimosum]KAJ5124289.1 cytochrome P450 [Penicillium bovifimosum]